jgi:polyhydroxybutyrate depolymerase
MKILFICSIIVLSLFLPILFSGCISETDYIEFNGEKRFFNVHLPEDYDSSNSYPLLFVFHGGGGNANNIEEVTNFSQKADEEGFIVVYPYGNGKMKYKLLTWNCGFCCGYALENEIDDVGFIRELFGYLENKYPVNKNKVYATGISNGGIMSYRVGSELSDIFTAISPVAAQIGGQATEEDDIWQISEPENPVSVIAFNGMQDTRVPYYGGKGEGKVFSWMSTEDSVQFWVESNNCNPTPDTTTSDSGNIIIDKYKEGSENTEVVLISIVDGTHSWPGGKKGWDNGPEPTEEISATDMIWDFFSKHTKK